jgi:hypothetical protein
MHNELWWGKLLEMLIWKTEKVIYVLVFGAGRIVPPGSATRLQR